MFLPDSTKRLFFNVPTLFIKCADTFRQMCRHIDFSDYKYREKNFSCADINSEQRELHDAVASFGLMLWNVDALRHEVVVFLSKGATMGKLFYAVEAVFGHLVRGYEYGLRLPFTPLIESFVVEASFVFL